METAINILEESEKILRDIEKPKILMVDDRPENLIALERLLKKMDVELYKAYNGNEALALTLHHDFALALLDIQMPEMDGYELAEFLRAEEKTANMPFIFISAIYTDHINVFKGYEKGAFSYITKPFNPQILLNKVQMFVEKHRQERALVKAQEILEQHIEELRKANKALKSFSYSVSHDLRSPLRIVDGYSKILLEDHEKKLNKDGKKVVSGIVRNVKKMTHLIDDLLNFSRISRQVMKPEKIDVKKMFEEVFNEQMEGQSKNSVEFIISDLTPVIADKALTKIMITNLLANAIKYSGKEASPKIEVGEYVNDKGVLVQYVQDNGVGFNETYKEKLFGVFQRLHGDEEFQGSGVGLAIAQRIIHHHKGEIWAKSEVGKGATFYFSFGKV